MSRGDAGFRIAVGLFGGLILVGALGRFASGMRPQATMRGLPLTPLERLGWLGAAVTAAVGVGLAVLVAVYGGTGLHEESTARGFGAFGRSMGIVLGYRRETAADA